MYGTTMVAIGSKTRREVREYYRNHRRHPKNPRGGDRLPRHLAFVYTFGRQTSEVVMAAEGRRKAPMTATERQRKWRAKVTTSRQKRPTLNSALRSVSYKLDFDERSSVPPFSLLCSLGALT